MTMTTASPPKKSRRGPAVAVAFMIASGGTMANEGIKTKAYLDGGGVPTICIGETRGVRMGQTATIAECKEKFGGRLYEFDVGIRKCLGDELVEAMPLTREASVVDLAYNIGLGQFCKSGVARLIKGGQTTEACKFMLKYSYIGPVWSQGLYNRRLRNQAECLAA